MHLTGELDGCQVPRNGEVGEGIADHHVVVGIWQSPDRLTCICMVGNDPAAIPVGGKRIDWPAKPYTEPPHGHCCHVGIEFDDVDAAAGGDCLQVARKGVASSADEEGVQRSWGGIHIRPSGRGDARRDDHVAECLRNWREEKPGRIRCGASLNGTVQAHRSEIVLANR